MDFIVHYNGYRVKLLNSLTLVFNTLTIPRAVLRGCSYTRLKNARPDGLKYFFAPPAMSEKLLEFAVR
jgi:hypothetical protein